MIILNPFDFRVGSLEVVLGKTPDTGLSGPSSGDKELLRAALNYTIDNFYPDISQNEQQKVSQGYSGIPFDSKSNAHVFLYNRQG